MRILVAIAVVVVFAAMLMFDTAALISLPFYCVTGGCGIDPIWIVIVTVILLLAALLRWRQPPATGKVSKSAGKAKPRSPRGQPAKPRKPRQAK